MQKAWSSHKIRFDYYLKMYINKKSNDKNTIIVLFDASVLCTKCQDSKLSYLNEVATQFIQGMRRKMFRSYSRGDPGLGSKPRKYILNHYICFQVLKVLNIFLSNIDLLNKNKKVIYNRV